jgi:hypothetical protein
MPIIRPELEHWGIEPPPKIHMRKEGGLSLCGLMSLDGEATEDPTNVTCGRCLQILKPPATHL